jgi:hypothetical protein
MCRAPHHQTMHIPSGMRYCLDRIFAPEAPTPDGDARRLGAAVGRAVRDGGVAEVCGVGPHGTSSEHCTCNNVCKRRTATSAPTVVLTPCSTRTARLRSAGGWCGRLQRRSTAYRAQNGSYDTLGDSRTSSRELDRKTPIVCGREARKTPNASYM